MSYDIKRNKNQGKQERSRSPERKFRLKQLRERECREKDSVIHPILESIEIFNPKNFAAMLMPCLYGPELIYLREHDVPPQNIFIVEKDRDVWKRIRNPTKHMPHLFGVSTTPKPMSATDAVDYLEADLVELDIGKFNLIYLDFFGRPDVAHIELLNKIFTIGMLEQESKLILTFGKTRCRSYVKTMSDILLKQDEAEFVPTVALVETALRNANYRDPVRIVDHPYVSGEGSNKVTPYVTTEIDFR